VAVLCWVGYRLSGSERTHWAGCLCVFGSNSSEKRLARVATARSHQWKEVKNQPTIVARSSAEYWRCLLSSRPNHPRKQKTDRAGCLQHCGVKSDCSEKAPPRETIPVVPVHGPHGRTPLRECGSQNGSSSPLTPETSVPQISPTPHSSVFSRVQNK
jgi:hypothetical protein